MNTVNKPLALGISLGMCGGVLLALIVGLISGDYIKYFPIGVGMGLGVGVLISQIVSSKKR